MSKGSQQQQPTTPRERKLTPVPREKQSSKAEKNGKSAAAREAGKPAGAVDATDGIGVVPSESEEDDFFARGDMNSYPPAAMDRISEIELDDADVVSVRPPLTPAQIERRARLRRIVGGVVGAAALITAIGGAKALATSPAKVTDSKGTLNTAQQVVPSIALAPEGTAAAAAKPEGDNPAQQVAEPAAVAAAPSNENAAAQANAAPENPPQGNSAPENVAPAAPQAAAPKADEGAKEPAATARRLPVIDLEVPKSTDPAIDEKWESAAKNLESKDFKGADTVFAELAKRGDATNRETARLARAVWWTANGRESEVRPVIADLAANATNPAVRQQARERLRTN